MLVWQSMWRVQKREQRGLEKRREHSRLKRKGENHEENQARFITLNHECAVR